MASEGKHISIVALNYPTWKVQCRMALIREGLWGIVSETEECPDRAEADKHAKFMARKDRALATIVLAVEPSLLYLLGDPEDPVEKVIWTIPEEDMGQQTKPQEEAIHHEIER